MEKLQWFKFNPTDWVMGKIQRCPEVTQARYLRLVCLYWNKEGVLSYEDAEIEIDKEHLDILIAKKVIKVEDEFISINFLKEQLTDIKVDKSDKSQSGQIGNLKRWHRNLYDKFVKNEITLNQAVEQSKLSHPDSTPIDTPSQNIADKRREEEIREDKSIYIKPFNFLNSMIEYGFTKNLVDDWIMVRKKKNLSNTETAFKGFIKQIELTNQDKNNVLEQCVINSWGGFKAEWLKPEVKKDLTRTKDHSSYYEDANGKRISKLAF